MSIATTIQNAQAKVAAAYTKCNSKGATMPVTQNLSNLADCIDSITGGGPTPVSDAEDVIFIDYDGTILHRYTFAEFLELTAMPSNPSHTGLVAQGWNWSLADAKTEAQNNCPVVIGQNYTTSDGKTRVYFSFTAADGEVTASPGWNQSADGGVTVDWGDGSPTETVSGTGDKTATHIYTTPGSYMITFNVTSGTMKIGNGSNNNIFKYSRNEHIPDAFVSKVEVGSGVVEIQRYGFVSMKKLETISLPNTITSIFPYSVRNCYSLKGFVVPSGITALEGNNFDYDSMLENVSLPASVTTLGGSVFSYCYSLKHINVSYLTSIGNNCFNYCYNLVSDIILRRLTSVGSSAFYYCTSINKASLPVVTTINNSVFQGCHLLETFGSLGNTITKLNDNFFCDCYRLTSVTIPSTVTQIGGNAFNGCGIHSINIPSGVTAIPSRVFYNSALWGSIDLSTMTSITSGAFSGTLLEHIVFPAIEAIPEAFTSCSLLREVVLPSGVKTIANNGFSGCANLVYIDLPATMTGIGTNAFNHFAAQPVVVCRATTPPTLGNTSVFPGSQPIYVPYGTSEVYKAATNWSSYSSRIQELDSNGNIPSA